MDCLLRSVIKCDFLGKPYHLRMMGRETFKSLFGGIISLILVCSMLSLGILSLINFFHRNSPKINYSTSLSQNLKINFQDKFPLAFLIRDAQGSSLPLQYDRIFNISGAIFNVTREGNVAIPIPIILKMTKCSKEFIQNNYNEELGNIFFNTLTQVESNNLSSFSCLVPLKKDFYITNVYGSTPSQLITFLFTPCENSTLNNNMCAPPETIKYYTSRFQLNMYSPSYYIDNTNFERPGNPYIFTQSFSFSTELRKQFLIFYRSIQYIKSTSYFSSEKVNLTFFQSESFSLDLTPKTSTEFMPDAIGSIILTSNSNIQQIVERIDTNIVEVLASLGGSLNALVFFGFVINSLIERKLKEMSIFTLCSAFLTNRKKEAECDAPLSHRKNLISNVKTRIYPKKKSDSEVIMIANNQIASMRKTIILKIEHNSLSEINFRASILDLVDFDSIIKAPINFCNLIFPYNLEKKQKEKILVANQFCEQMFDLQFLFGWIIDTQNKNKN